MSQLVQNVSLITVIYSMLWLPLIVAVILWPTHLFTAHGSVSVPSSRLWETRVPRRRAQLSALSYSIKQSHRNGLSLPFCFSFKSCNTGPSGCRWSSRNLSSALVCHPLSSSEVLLKFNAHSIHIYHLCKRPALVERKKCSWFRDFIPYFCISL